MGQIHEFFDEEDFNQELESVMDKIDKLEKAILSRAKAAPEFLLLDVVSYDQLKYERGFNGEIHEYHGYTVGVIFTSFEEVIRFI